MWCCAVQLDLKKQDGRGGGREKLKGGRKGTLEKVERISGMVRVADGRTKERKR